MATSRSSSTGTWVAAAGPVVLPWDAAAQPNAQIDGIACPAINNCVAVGNYSTAGSVRAFIVTQSSGVWGTAVNPGLPSNAVPLKTSYLRRIACAKPGECEAVGSFADIEGHFEPMTVSEVAGIWHAGSEPKLPGDAPTNTMKKGYPFGVACTSAGNCVAVGSYVRVVHKVAATVAMGLADSNGKWGQAKEITPPGNASSGSGNLSSLAAVACLANGHCQAVGSCQAGSPVDAMTSIESNASWARAAQLTAVPRRANFFGIGGIACSTSTFCVSVGAYHTLRGRFQPLAVTWNGSNWNLVGPVTPPANAATGRKAVSLLTAVACVSTTNCEVLGTYRDKSGGYQVMAFTLS